jgi:predicted ATPase
VLKARRRELHRKVADVLATASRSSTETEPELLAQHYTDAGARDRALLYWRKAGQRASARLAFVEALGHVEAAMKIVAELPESAERDEWELGFLAIEGPSKMALEAWDSPSAKSLYEKARAVAERLGRPAEVFRSVWGLWMGAHSSGQHVRAHELYEEIFDLLKQTNEPEYWSKRTMPADRRWSGKASRARRSRMSTNCCRTIASTCTAISRRFTVRTIRDAAPSACGRSRW